MRIASTGPCVVLGVAPADGCGTALAPDGAALLTAGTITRFAPGVGVEPKAPPSNPHAMVVRKTTANANNINHERRVETIECCMWILLS
jgi:hypothetical protein